MHCACHTMMDCYCCEENACSSGCLVPFLACNCVQGILGVLLREPLLDWQREAAVLKGQGRSPELQQQALEETYIPLKVRC